MLLCLQGARPRGGARASRRLLATGCAGGGRPNVRTRGARCILTTRRDGSDRARRGGVDHARRDGADRARRDERRRPPRQRERTVRPRGPRPPGCDFDFGPVGFRSRAGANSLGVSWVGREAMAISFVVSYLSAMALSIVKKKKMHSDHAERCALRIKVRATGCAVSVRRHGADGARRDDADGAGRRRGWRAETARRDGAETARRDGAETARRDGADGARRRHGRRA